MKNNMWNRLRSKFIFPFFLLMMVTIAMGCDGGFGGGSGDSGIPTYSDDWPVTGALDVHDPSIIKAGGTYYIFATGVGIQVKRSNDGLAWSNAGRVFNSYPSWADSVVPDHESNIWAPDIRYFNGTYYLYYSVSSFGSNTSAIGLATTTSLSNPNWQDRGMVIRSTSSDNYNCIDPNLVIDASKTPWLAFGSFWDGIMLIELDPSTMKPRSGASMTNLAKRSSTAIEGAYIVYRNGYYYLFVNFDYCCRGANSSTKIVYGRSTAINGTYYDKNGVSMLDGGGTIFDAGNDRWRGPGGHSLLGTEAICHHAYDAYNYGVATLMIKNVYWSADGWPSKDNVDVDGDTSTSTDTDPTPTNPTTPFPRRPPNFPFY